MSQNKQSNDKYTVKTISEYIKIVEDIGMEDYIYRGQIHPYFGIEASGFRPYLGGWTSDKIYNIEKLADDFYKRVLNKLSEDEKKYFPAYCQHHGLPTNLVDFSYSPLVALFFSCDGKDEMTFKLSELISNYSIDELENDNDLKDMLVHNLINKSRKSYYSKSGRVYLIKKSKLIDITDIIVDFGYINIFERMLEDKDLRQRIGLKIINHFAQINSKDAVQYIVNLIEIYKENLEQIFLYQDKFDNENEKVLLNYSQELKKSGDKDKVIRDLYIFVMCEFNLDKQIYSLDELFNEEGQIYFLLLYNLICCFKDNPNKYSCILDLYFTYTPPNLFPRLERQQGLFIYQPYLYTNDDVYDYNELTIQKIIPDITIEIDNYNSVKYELDCLGIDAGFLYGDVDNISKSVQMKSLYRDTKK